MILLKPKRPIFEQLRQLSTYSVDVPRHLFQSEVFFNHMPPTSNSNKNVLAIGVIVAVLVIAGSSYAAYQFGYGRGVNAFQTQSVAIPVRTVFGTVEKISGQEITLSHFMRVPSFAASTSPSATMTITVDQATVLERVTLKDLSAVKAQGATPAPTEPYTIEKITLDDIKVGGVITAFASGDISNVTAFTATKIDLQSPPTKASATPLKP